ncbi:hypothetical protein DPMN_168548 [Dreissena polymorpha]|uniref:Uncharacterized protein n=1 Tax=Dreissena polymorpha TaxID=45954 RepID=A0A9D4F5S1_DREPO|nr:hypothetical protein DPMN_168548 [Dreissena polymorpha]
MGSAAKKNKATSENTCNTASTKQTIGQKKIIAANHAARSVLAEIAKYVNTPPEHDAMHVGSESSSSSSSSDSVIPSTPTLNTVTCIPQTISQAGT